MIYSEVKDISYAFDELFKDHGKAKEFDDRLFKLMIDIRQEQYASSKLCIFEKDSSFDSNSKEPSHERLVVAFEF